MSSDWLKSYPDNWPENLSSLCQMHHHWVDNELRAKTRRETWIRKRAKKQAAQQPIAAPETTISTAREAIPVIRLHGRNWGNVSSTGPAHGHHITDDSAVRDMIGTFTGPVPLSSFGGRFVAVAWAKMKGKQ